MKPSCLGVGMADALITRLSNIRRMVVRPTSSVLRYAQGNHDLLAAARSLDVHYILDGRIRRAGDRIRITVQLVRGRDGAPLWAAKFDGSRRKSATCCISAAPITRRRISFI